MRSSLDREEIIDSKKTGGRETGGFCEVEEQMYWEEGLCGQEGKSESRAFLFKMSKVEVT